MQVRWFAMTVTVNIHEAKTHLSQLFMRVVSGEEVVITRAGVPVARRVSVRPKPNRRVPGRLAGKMVIAPDFDEPLPEDVLAEFER